MARRVKTAFFVTCPVCKRAVAASGEARKLYRHMPYEPGKALFLDKGRPCKAAGKTFKEARDLAARAGGHERFWPLV